MSENFVLTVSPQPYYKSRKRELKGKTRGWWLFTYYNESTKRIHQTIDCRGVCFFIYRRVFKTFNHVTFSRNLEFFGRTLEKTLVQNCPKGPNPLFWRIGKGLPQRFIDVLTVKHSKTYLKNSAHVTFMNHSFIMAPQDIAFAFINANTTSILGDVLVPGARTSLDNNLA